MPATWRSWQCRTRRRSRPRSAGSCGGKFRAWVRRGWMAELTMPKMGDAMEEGTLLQWLKKEGETVKEEEPVAEIETEKATIEIPSYQSGILTQILVQEGQTVPVGTPIALIQVDGEPASP